MENKSFNDWCDSQEGKKCLDGNTFGSYLRNRLERAFLAGVSWSEQRWKFPKRHRSILPYGRAAEERALLKSKSVGEKFVYPTNSQVYRSAEQLGMRIKTVKLNGAYEVEIVSRNIE